VESTETFESSFLSWKAKEVLPHGAIGVKAKSLGNRILVIGALHQSQEYSPRIFSFDDALETWSIEKILENEKAATIDIEEKRDFEKYCSMTKIQQSKKQITKRFAKNKLPKDLPYRPGSMRDPATSLPSRVPPGYSAPDLGWVQPNERCFEKGRTLGDIIKKHGEQLALCWCFTDYDYAQCFKCAACNLVHCKRRCYASPSCCYYTPCWEKHPGFKEKCIADGILDDL